MPIFRWKNIWISFCCLAIICFCFSAAGGTSSTFECLTASDSCLPVRYAPPIDTIHAVVLYRTDSPPGPLLE
jgi:hypothetical protein